MKQDVWFRWLLVCLMVAFSILPLPSARAQEPSCDQSIGLVAQRSYYSALLDANLSYAVYTPRCYFSQDFAERLYPIVYLLHGSDAVDDEYWLRLGLQKELDGDILSGMLPPMIVVMPYGDWLANTNQFGAVSWGNVILKELLPAVESTYRVNARREYRAIGGISRGGFWAFNIAFQRPDLFGAVGGHSPYFWYGVADSANPLVMADTLPNLDTLRIWLDCGVDDIVADNMTIMHNKLDARQIPNQFTIYPEGTHESTYWASHLRDYMLFYVQPWLELGL